MNDDVSNLDPVILEKVDLIPSRYSDLKSKAYSLDSSQPCFSSDNKITGEIRIGQSRFLLLRFSDTSKYILTSKNMMRYIECNVINRPAYGSKIQNNQRPETRYLRHWNYGKSRRNTSPHVGPVARGTCGSCARTSLSTYRSSDSPDDRRPKGEASRSGANTRRRNYCCGTGTWRGTKADAKGPQAKGKGRQGLKTAEGQG